MKPKIQVSVDPARIGHRIADVGPGGVESNVETVGPFPVAPYGADKPSTGPFADALLCAAAPGLVDALEPGPLGFCYQLDLAVGILRGEIPTQSIDCEGLADYLAGRIALIEAALRKAGRLS